MTVEADTIFALSSGQDRAGVAVVRISGPQAGSVVSEMVRVVVTPRRATRAVLVDPVDGAALDDALVLWFPAPKSFTGEDVLELHVHGGRAVVGGVLGVLGRLTGLRMAEPGEFTRRAFENGKIDLTEAEGLGDLIAAETEAQRRLALRQMAGELHRTAERWRSTLVRAQALMEAAIDFADESDVSERAVADAAVLASMIAAEFAEALADKNRGEILRGGFQVVIAGAPNVGKSSLINAIARREAAIVSTEAGTTRDIIELHLNLDGLAVTVADTAGVRLAEGPVEREGIRRGLVRAQAADLVLWVVDTTGPSADGAPPIDGYEGEILLVANKADLRTRISPSDKLRKQPANNVVAVSALTGEGISELEARIAQAARARTRGGETALITSARHRQRIQAAANALSVFAAGDKSEFELRAEDLRQASHEIGKLVGRVDVEEILGEIFSRFCIGK